MYNKYLQRAAEDKNKDLMWLWVIITIILVVFFLFTFGQIPSLALAPKLMSGELSGLDAKNLTPENTGLSELYLIFMQLFPFVTIVAALFVGVKFFHKRPFASMLTGFQKVRWSRFFLGFALWFTFSAIVMFITYLVNPENFTFQFDAKRFFPFALLAIIMVPIQSSAEEMFFRGYLMQTMSRMTRHKIIPLLVTSALFGLVHSMNPEVDTYGFGIMMVNYMGMGLILGIVTLADEGLEMAMGLHSANNLFAFLFVSYPGIALDTPSIIHLGEINPAQDLIGIFGFGILFILLTNAKRLKSFAQRVFLSEPNIYHEPEPEVDPEENPLLHSD